MSRRARWIFAGLFLLLVAFTVGLFLVGLDFWEVWLSLFCIIVTLGFLVPGEWVS